MDLRGMLAIEHNLKRYKSYLFIKWLRYADTLSEYVPTENIIMGTTV